MPPGLGSALVLTLNPGLGQGAAMTDPTLTIGQVASQAGINVSAVRFYEREGLLPAAERVGGQRRFGEDTIQRLGTIDVAKQAGFSLDEIRVLLTSIDSRGARSATATAGAQRIESCRKLTR